MKTIQVSFLDSTYNYITSVSEKSTKQSLEKYFVNQHFDVGTYPVENLQRCVSIMFCNYYYKNEKGVKVPFEQLTLNGIYILKGFQDERDRGKVCVHRNNALIPVFNWKTDEQLILEELSEVIFDYERKKIGIDKDWLCWTDKINLYCFDNDDNLRLIKSIEEVDKVLEIKV